MAMLFIVSLNRSGIMILMKRDRQLSRQNISPSSLPVPLQVLVKENSRILDLEDSTNPFAILSSS
jgi:hypothetical protein